MKLLVVESPSKAKTINQYLGKEYKVVSSYGHIRALPSENGSVEPDKDFKMHFEILDKSKKNVDEIIKSYKSCDTLLLATDPDREGEAISWHIVEAIKERKAFDPKIPIKRVVFNEITKNAIIDAVQNPREINQDLVEAQQARQALDYLVGFTLSPVLWRKLPGSRSAGRVQSVALRLVSEREEEIEKFNREEYWTIEADFLDNKKSQVTANLTTYKGQKLEKFSIIDEATASATTADLSAQDFFVASMERKESRRQPHAPFTTSTMLQEAARKLGFSAKKTSKLAQDLYEGAEIGGKSVGLITYMRTDSVSVSNVAIDGARKLIGDKYGKNYLPEKPRFFKNKSKNAQEAHEAIRPTDIALTPDKVASSLSSDHYKLYNLIWRRMVASQMNPAVMDGVTYDLESARKGDIFRATGSVIKFDGFLAVYGKDLSKDEAILPNLSKGEKVDIEKITPSQHFTEPPPRYSEASLVKKLEELGIGRPSTYPSIIAVLQDRGYVHLDKKRFIADPKGRVVNAFLTSFFEKYVQYDFTAKLEDELDEISHGNASSRAILTEFWGPFKHQIDEVLQIKLVEVLTRMEDKLASYLYKEKDRKCNVCNNGEMKLKIGRYGPFLGCSNYPECKHLEKIPEVLVGMAQSDEAPDETGVDFPKALGESDGKTYTLKKGPYGPYIEVTGGEELKRYRINARKALATVDLEYAKQISSLPRVVGEHPQYGKVTAGAGRFGPYLEFMGAYVSIKGTDPALVTMDEAALILEQKAEAALAKKKAQPAKGDAPAKKSSAKKAPAKKTTKKKAPAKKAKKEA